MAENQTQKKNKKTKKKSESKSDSEVKTNTKTMNHAPKDASVKEYLNLTTPSNIEVTLVKKDDKIEESANASNSKKKKKSKKKLSKEESKEVEPESAGNSSKQSLLNFTENGIHLLNHPEISVTFTNAETPKVSETEKKIQQHLGKEEKKNDNDAASTAKKKKKNKKKNDNSDKNPPPNVPASSIESTGTIVTPTYTKVVTSDNTCVLVVNNDNLAAAAKAYDNMENDKLEKNKVQFPMSNDRKSGDVLITKKSGSDSNIQLSNTVSLFPVLPNGKENALEKSLDLPSSLETVPDNLGKDDNIGDNAQESAPTKAQLKAERRAKQEAQRAAKLTKGSVKVESNSSGEQKNPQKPLKEAVLQNKNNTPTITVTEKPAKTTVSDKDSLRKVRLFSHLPEHKQVDVNTMIHPAILEVGSQYNKGIICGSDARCIAMLAALKEVIQDYKSQPGKNLSRELDSSIQTYLSFLNNCRPLSVSMANAVKFLKRQINHLPPETEDGKAKVILCKFIDDFVNEEILLAKEAIGYSASEKIVDGDVILVFSYSSLVKHVLFKAYNENKQFRVVVADSRPKLEGLEMLRCLVKQGLYCSYVPINAVSYVMKEVTKVIIGAHALLANGCVMSRLGSKQIALVASSYSVPVLVCCETYKFCERVLTDSFVHNELGEPNDLSVTLIESNNLKNWKDIPSLQLLNLLYDVTPSDLISMVVTEKGVLPCTSVPVVLRVRYAGLHE